MWPQFGVHVLLKAGLDTVEARQFQRGRPLTPSQRKRENRHKSSYIHFWSGVGGCVWLGIGLGCMNVIAGWPESLPIRALFLGCSVARGK